MEVPSLDSLPLVLAGPIVRSVSPTTATIWIATKTACEVTLTIKDEATTTATTRLGPHLHVALATVAANTLDKVIRYELSFECAGERLSLVRATQGAPLAYLPTDGPTIVGPPRIRDDLRIAHTSCRLFSGSGPDALIRLDTSNAVAGTSHKARIQQLLFTGDQIYADHVNNHLLRYISTLASVLVGEETLDDGTIAAALQGSSRQRYINKKAGLLERAKHGHLISFGEFAVTYLLYWSPTLWPRELTDDKLAAFRNGLWRVRRLLANTPTYMVLDDHEITDDAFMTRGWCESALTKPLGRRIVRNALRAYALFQAWGNRPDYAAETMERIASGNNCDEALGVPTPDQVIIDGTLAKSPHALSWGFEKHFPTHALVALDLRTTRQYGAKKHGRASLSAAVPKQTGAPLAILISAFPLVRAAKPWWHQLISHVVYGVGELLNGQRGYARMYGPDGGDQWNIADPTLPQLLATLAASYSQVVVCSGDIHQSFAAKLNYESERARCSLVQFTASPCNRPTAAGLSAQRLTRHKQPIELWGWNERPTLTSDLPPPWNGSWREPALDTPPFTLARHKWQSLAVTPAPTWRLSGHTLCGTDSAGDKRVIVGGANVGILSFSAAQFILRYLSGDHERVVFVGRFDH